MFQPITEFKEVLPQMVSAFKGQPTKLYNIEKSDIKTHPLMQVPQLYLHLNSTERKRAALYLYYIVAGFCLKESIVPCIPDDAFDLADRVMTGDKDCAFTCGKSKTMSGFPKLPPTLGELSVTIASKWYPVINSPDQVIIMINLGQVLTPDPAEMAALNHFTLFHMDLVVRHAVQLAVAGVWNMTDSEIQSTFTASAETVIEQLEGRREQKEQGGVS